MSYVAGFRRCCAMPSKGRRLSIPDDNQQLLTFTMTSKYTRRSKIPCIIPAFSLGGRSRFRSHYCSERFDPLSTRTGLKVAFTPIYNFQRRFHPCSESKGVFQHILLSSSFLCSSTFRSFCLENVSIARYIFHTQRCLFEAGKSPQY